MVYVMPVRAIVPHRDRLAEVLAIARDQGSISLELGTFWATARDAGASPVGCLLGHYVSQRGPAHLALVRLNFMEQIKAPIVAGQVLEKYPNTAWRHHTLHYTGPDVEAWGLNAACLYFQLRPYDCLTLFWPAGTNYQLEVPASLVAERLKRFLKTEQVLQEEP